MVGFYCAVDTCWGSTASKHTFPNPNKNNDLFNKWVTLCKNKRLMEMEPKKIYTNCRVCRLHFTEEDFERNNRLKRKTYPTKSLPGCEDTSISQTLPESDVDIVNVFVADDHDYLSKPISLVQPVPSTSSSQNESDVDIVNVFVADDHDY
ncbi:unnamed protein product [Brassicogethes aeneus]|uniref:THAP-type domain-containing protein n=1 Tax=Brassicogethes aeneus TaxID=1431903 RepID=A0A9P0B431_BRAAE|nr:unnamed protein product [Brassicogethes aeneus]